MQPMTLHDAMVHILREHGRGWMDRDELARRIGEPDLYRRRDGAAPPSDQLRLRARKYPHLFECSDVRCSHIRLRQARSGAPQPTARKRPASRQDSKRAAAEEDSRDTSAFGWYEDLRERYRPARLLYLLVAESPPDSGSGDRRFFYSPRLTIDILYRGVAEAVYGRRPEVDLLDKPAVLERLKNDGFWLIDAVARPINKERAATRARAIAGAAPELVARIRDLAPERGVIVCHAKLFAAVAPHLRRAGLPLLHDEAIPFPLGNWRNRFVADFRRALTGQAKPVRCDPRRLGGGG